MVFIFTLKFKVDTKNITFYKMLKKEGLDGMNAKKAILDSILRLNK